METVGGMPVLGTVDESGRLHMTADGKKALLGDSQDEITLTVPPPTHYNVVMDTEEAVAPGLDQLALVVSDAIHSIDGIAVPLGVNVAYYVAEARRKLLLAMLDMHSAARCQRND